ncbi:MAG TPA: hypothetical protein VE988_03505 [Gemmataceae bacterium]|nr:hypothetical protein [Gemmataceae bacterium]
MAIPSENETWLIDIGDAVIRKQAGSGTNSLLSCEKLVHCFWVADYGMRNAGDLDVAGDVYSEFHSEGLKLATALSLPLTQAIFALSKDDLENVYFDRFESICNEIKKAWPADAVQLRTRRKKR